MDHREGTGTPQPGSRRRAAVLALVAAIVAGPAQAGDRVRLDLEGSAAWQQRNDFAVPGGTGTRVDLPRADDSPTFTGRAVIATRASGEWWLRGVYAPLRTVTTIVPAAPVTFQDATFAAGGPLAVEYVFNSYRLSFYRRFPAGADGELRLGLTAKVRDAKIALASGAQSREETDLGFVPLVHAGVTLAPWPRARVDLDVDALGAAQGYAVDGTLRVLYPLGGGLHAFAGYRVLDGGADVDRVYSFGTFHYATAGLSMRR